jgi:hypothetical protein
MKMRCLLIMAVAALAGTLAASGATSALVGWNNLGMHCMDSDFSVFSILPPYNTIEAQLIVGGPHPERIRHESIVPPCRRGMLHLPQRAR